METTAESVTDIVPHNARLRDVLLAIACLATSSLALRLVPLRQILRVVFARQRALANDGHDYSVKAVTLAKAMGVAGAIYIGRALCLERSLALFILMTLRRVPEAALHIGVTPYGFKAHAWVSYRGHPLNERPDRIKDYVPFPIG